MNSRVLQPIAADLEALWLHLPLAIRRFRYSKPGAADTTSVTAPQFMVLTSGHPTGRGREIDRLAAESLLDAFRHGAVRR